MRQLFNYPISLFHDSVSGMGKYFFLIFLSIKSLAQSRENLDNILSQMINIGIKSVPIVIFTSLFSGMVAGVQATYQFQIETIESGLLDLSPEFLETSVEFLGSVIGTSVVLELGPMITALVMTGKIGATIAAEIGTMRITEQIDALESLSFNPIAYLVMPRILAAILMFPYLVLIADIFGIIGGMAAGLSSYDELTVEIFVNGLSTYGNIQYDSIFGMIKGVFFGFAISSIACYQGYYASGGAAGVGKSTTSTVVLSCVAVVILDYVLAAILL